jgi:F-type H+-transporting ATPase subunit delta
MRGKQETVALIYAHAILELAFEKGVAQEVLSDLGKIGQALKDDPRILTFLVAPHIRREAKKQTLDRAFARGISPLVSNFLKVLVDKRREEEIPRVLSLFEKLYHERQGEAVVRVVSAVSLNEGERSRLSKELKRRLKKEILLEERVDPALLGGVVIRVDDSVADSSLRTKLAAIAERLHETRVVLETVFLS